MSTDFKISIAAARKNSGLTQQQVADILGVSKFTVLNWETGKTEPSVSQLAKISELAKIPMDYIFVPEK